MRAASHSEHGAPSASSRCISRNNAPWLSDRRLFSHPPKQCVPAYVAPVPGSVSTRKLASLSPWKGHTYHLAVLVCLTGRYPWFAITSSSGRELSLCLSDSEIICLFFLVSLYCAPAGSRTPQLRQVLPVPIPFRGLSEHVLPILADGKAGVQHLVPCA